MHLSKVLILVVFLLSSLSSVFADSTDSKAPRLLPDQIGKFRQLKSDGNPAPPNFDTGSPPVQTEQADYVSNAGERFSVEIARFRQDQEAYEMLSLVAAAAREKQPDLEVAANIGTAGFTNDKQSAFVKGAHFVRITRSKATPDSTSLQALAQSLSGAIDKGEADIPVLIKHLPNPEEAQKNAVFLSSFADLSKLGLPQAVLSAIASEGNADAALASYGPSKVLIVEFNTPQLASDNDKRIIAKIQELWKLGQRAPTAYRRVGNYSVFVFDAPDEQTAKQLIDQVKYEQVVSWLGDNPNILREAEERYINTTLGVLVSVLKASGYAAVACFGIGGLIGALLFSYRRAQQRAVTAYSDAGGMLRLNLDELTPTTDPSRLLRDRN